MNSFFIVCPIGWEKDLEWELKEFWPYLINKDGRTHFEALNITGYDKGGLFIENSVHLGLQINYFSKLASRVLLRVDQFTAKDFPKLFQKLKKIQWDPLVGKQVFSVQVAASKSRLGQEKRILGVAEEAWGQRIDQSSSVQVLIRIFDDVCTVSLDTSGEHLHKRGWATLKGEAPLRETVASWMLRQMIFDSPISETRKLNLVDPMAGSGTLLSEAFHLYKPNFERNYSFINFPMTPKIFSSSQLKGNYPSFDSPFKQLWAFEKEEKMIPVLQKNLSMTESKIALNDLFNIEKNKPILGDSGPCWVVLNPPYGERLSVDFTPKKLFDALIQRFSPARMGLLLGEGQSHQAHDAKMGPYQLVSKKPVLNGGLKTFFHLYHKN